jgi:hypothetical protein
MDGGRSPCAVGDNPNHLLKTWRESGGAGQALPHILASRQPSANASWRNSSTDNVSALRARAISNRCNVSITG